MSLSHPTFLSNLLTLQQMHGALQGRGKHCRAVNDVGDGVEGHTYPCILCSKSHQETVDVYMNNKTVDKGTVFNLSETIKW